MLMKKYQIIFGIAALTLTSCNNAPRFTLNRNGNNFSNANQPLYIDIDIEKLTMLLDEANPFDNLLYFHSENCANCGVFAPAIEQYTRDTKLLIHRYSLKYIDDTNSFKQAEAAFPTYFAEIRTPSLYFIHRGVPKEVWNYGRSISTYRGLKTNLDDQVAINNHIVFYALNDYLSVKDAAIPALFFNSAHTEGYNKLAQLLIDKEKATLHLIDYAFMSPAEQTSVLTYLQVDDFDVVQR